MRLIDADLIQYEPMLSAKGNGMYEDVMVAYKSQINDMPTIERNRSEWLPHIEKSREYIGTFLVNVSYDYWFCDACGYRLDNGQQMYNFCPNCGADMRGGQE